MKSEVRLSEVGARKPSWPSSAVVIRWSLFLLGLVTIWSIALLHRDVTSPYVTANDMTPDYISARAWVHDVDPYAPIPVLKSRYLGPSAPYFVDSPADQRNAHPPIYIVLFTPFALLPIKAARIVWLVMSAGTIALSVSVFAREIGWSRRAQLAAAAITISIPAVRSDLFFGQSNGIALLLLVFAWMALRRDQDRRAGWLLGVLAALRVFPVLLVIPLLRMRRLRTVVWMAGTTAFLSVAGVLLLGLHSTRIFLETASPANTKYWIAQPGNVSLVGLPFRWLTHNRWMAAGISETAIAVVVAVVIFASCCIAMYRTPARVSGDVFWAAIPWLLLATPLSWFHYAVMLLPLVILLERRTRGEGMLRIFVILACAGALVARLVADRLIAAGLDGYSVFVQVAGYSIAMYGLIGLAALEWSKRLVDSAVAPGPRALPALTTQV